MGQKKTDGVDLIAAERYEQIKKHGRTIAYDVEQNKYWELPNGAVALLEGNLVKFSSKWDGELMLKMISKSYMERLIIAGALIAAEIDRIQATECLIEKTAV